MIFSVSHDANGGGRPSAVFYLDGGVMSGKGHLFSSGGGVIPGIPGGSDFEDSHGHVVALVLPVGKHAFDYWQITNGTGLRIYPKEKPPPLVFEVIAGQVKYLGNLHAHLASGKNLVVMTVTGDGFPEVRDERHRDVPMFQEKYPQYQAKVVVELLALGPWIADLETRKQLELSMPVQKK